MKWAWFGISILIIFVAAVAALLWWLASLIVRFVLGLFGVFHG